MSPDRPAFVHEVLLSLDIGTDPAAVGASVTTELCGANEHPGPCRWPHNNAVRASSDQAELRTVFIAAPSEVDEVRRRIGAALRASSGWAVDLEKPGSLREDEAALAARLASTPG